MHNGNGERSSNFVASIIGHAVGDAMGMPTEFHQRKNLQLNPVTEMTESKERGKPAGSWTDDTSMEIAIIDSFIQNNRFDYNDIMSKWCDWLENGKYTPNGSAFGVGRTCLRACGNYASGINPLECGLSGTKDNGNGSLMRILPVALYSFYRDLSPNELMLLSNDISSLTHAHDISKMGCYMYSRFVVNLLQGFSKEKAYEYMQCDDYRTYSDEAIRAYDRLLSTKIATYKMDEISSLGYVVDTWECALWILLNTESYRGAIITSTNIGNDTDTIGAITGSMAGIIYGYDAIPDEWVNSLLEKDYLINLAFSFESSVRQ